MTTKAVTCLLSITFLAGIGVIISTVSRKRNSIENKDDNKTKTKTKNKKHLPPKQGGDITSEDLKNFKIEKILHLDAKNLYVQGKFPWQRNQIE